MEGLLDDGYIRALQATASFIRDGQDLNFGNFCLVDLPLLPLEEQKAIAEYLDKAAASIDTLINRARAEVELLREYRTRLIADVVSGKFDVREAEAQLPNEPEDSVPLDRLDSADADDPGDEADFDTTPQEAADADD